jgi:hypothetical protein
MNMMLFILILSAGLSAQDVMVGLTRKQVTEYWQKKVPAEQIINTGDLIRIGDAIFCSFGKKVCTEYTAVIGEAEAEKYRAVFNADKELRYDKEKEQWINDAKKYYWQIEKSDNNYQLSCKML